MAQPAKAGVAKLEGLRVDKAYGSQFPNEELTFNTLTGNGLVVFQKKRRRFKFTMGFEPLLFLKDQFITRESISTILMT